jgi:hypothetical protein
LEKWSTVVGISLWTFDRQDEAILIIIVLIMTNTKSKFRTKLTYHWNYSSY